MEVMRILLLFVLVIAVVLWLERIYWKKRARLLESRLLGKHRSESNSSLVDAWIDGRIESRLRKQRGL